MPRNEETEEGEVEVSAAPAPAKTPSPWPPLIAAIVVMPIISFAITQFVLIPKMRESLIKAAVEGVAMPPAERVASGANVVPSGKKKDEKPTTFEYSFDNIVVNVSGTKGTRYLKTSFTVFSPNSELKTIITRHRTELLNLTLNILSAKSLVDLETPGAKNMLLGELQENFNHTLNSSLIDQIFFSEFVIQ